MTMPHEQQVHQVCYLPKNDAFYTAAAVKQTKMAAGGNRVAKEDSLQTNKWGGAIILVGLMTIKTN